MSLDGKLRRAALLLDIQPNFLHLVGETNCHILHWLLPVTEHGLSVLVLIWQCGRIKSIQAILDFELVGRYPPQPVSVLWPPYPVTLLPNGSGYFLSQTSSRIHPNIYQTQFIPHTPTCLWRWNRVFRNVGTKFRHRGITQKKSYSIQAVYEFPPSYSTITLRFN
jgi:hypothetical protein